ncbi:MAG: CoA-transferase [Anaerolineae bacterium]
MMDYTIDELICVCISRQVVDGEVLAQGINTPLVVAGFILAQMTHAPNVIFASAIGQSICKEWAPLGVGRIEDLWLGKGLIHLGFVSAAADLLPKFNPKEFFRPAQVDAVGNFNNVAFGRDYRRPRMRLPGTGGIPDVTPYSEQVYLYVPRHSRITFVEKVDFVSGMGHVPERTRGRGPNYLITDLGQFDWANGRMRLTHTHPGVSVEDCAEKDRLRAGDRARHGRDRAAVRRRNPPAARADRPAQRAQAGSAAGGSARKPAARHPRTRKCLVSRD